MKPLTLKTKVRRLYGQSDTHNDLYNEDKTDTPVDPAHFNVNLLRSGLLSASATVGNHECRSHIRGNRQEGMRVFDNWAEIPLKNTRVYWHLFVDMDVPDSEISQSVTNFSPNEWSLKSRYDYDKNQILPRY
jgi:hypothetical protein